MCESPGDRTTPRSLIFAVGTIFDACTVALLLGEPSPGRLCVCFREDPEEVPAGGGGGRIRVRCEDSP